MDEEDHESVTNHVKTDEEDNSCVTNNVKMDDEDHNSVGSTGDVSAVVLVNGDSVAKDIQARADIHFELQKKQIQVFCKVQASFLISVTLHFHHLPLGVDVFCRI